MVGMTIIHLDNSQTDTEITDYIATVWQLNNVIWRGLIILKNKNEDNQREIKVRCYTKPEYREKIKVCAPKDKSLSEYGISIRLPEIGIEETKLKVIIGQKISRISFTKYGQEKNDCEKFLEKQYERFEGRTLWIDEENQEDEMFSSIHQQNFENFLKAVPEGLKTYMLNQPKNTLYDFIWNRVNEKMINLLKDLNENSSLSINSISHENWSRSRDSPDLLVNEIVLRFFSDYNQNE